jgi:hypothetical protein
MPPSPLLVRATLLALVGSPSWALGAPPEPADEGDSPVRVEESDHALRVSVRGQGETPEAAVRDAERQRDRALAKKLAGGLNRLQVHDGESDTPTTWPGGSVVEQVVEATANGHIARLVYQLADRRVLAARFELHGAVFAYRVQPRSGMVVLATTEFLEGLIPGDVVLGHDGGPIEGEVDLDAALKASESFESSAREHRSRSPRSTS